MVSTLDEEGIRHRLKLWGAIPRLVLANVDRSFQTKARAEIESVPTEKLEALALCGITGSQRRRDDAPHCARKGRRGDCRRRYTRG